MASCGSLEARVAGADVAAALLTLRLPTRELRGAVAAFLAGDLEWRSMVVAARYGRLTLLRLLHESPSELIVCSQDAMDMAASAGYLCVVQWLHTHRSDGCTTRAMDTAASNGHLQVIQWLHASRSEGCTTLAMDGAAANGHMAVLQWLTVHRGEGASPSAVHEAAQRDRVDVVAWLWRHQPALFDAATVKAAVQGAVLRGRLPVLQWFVEEARLLTMEDVATLEPLARAAGQTDVVQWIRTKQQKDSGDDAQGRWSYSFHRLWTRFRVAETVVVVE